ncbi:MAG: alkaline phosphatase D family protein [Opitutaceae bacterium]|nr:alkaline phosphatase D family protein [Opitutaceae bacterium]
MVSSHLRRLTGLGLLAVWLSLAASAGTGPVRWMWSGAVAMDSARVKAGVSGNVAPDLLLTRGEAMTLAGVVKPAGFVRRADGGVADYRLTGLEPDTVYHYEIGGEHGRFRTFPAGPASFSLVLGSCAQTGSSHPVFATMARHEPLFFLHTGDLHYEDIKVDDIREFRAAFDRVLSAPVQSALYRQTPVDYVWDDHDFGPGNADGSSRSRPAAWRAYREHVPHYPLPAGDDGPVYHAFTVGRVRFIVLDTRSLKSPPGLPDGPARTTLGEAQRAWLKAELLAARDTHALTVLVSSVSWVADDGSPDRWSGFAHERRELADFIVASRIRNLCMLSGDAHMLAIDDGRHNQYAAAGGPGFPIFQAAALDRSGSVKGGPYSHGTFPGGGQFGLMKVSDDGGPQVFVEWTGRNHEDRVIVEHRFAVQAPAGARGAAR